MDDSRLFKRLRRTAKDIGERALQEIMNTDGGADALGVAVKSVQQGRRILDESSIKLLGALGLATQADSERVTRKVGKLRKRLEALEDTLEEAE